LAAWVALAVSMSTGGCAALMGGESGTVRLENATAGTPICSVQIGNSLVLDASDKPIAPGASGTFKASVPSTPHRQASVMVKPCKGIYTPRQQVEFARGNQHWVVFYDGAEPPKLDTPAGFVRYDLHNSEDTSVMQSKPDWQDEKGVKPDWVFFSMRNQCDHDIAFKYEPSGGAADVSVTPAAKAEAHQWAGTKGNPYVELGRFAPKPLTIWIRDRRKGTGDWMETLTIEPGSSHRLEIDASCTKVVERTDSDRFYGCYQWAYSRACRDVPMSNQPPMCPEGTPSIEGDTGKTCEVQTPKGRCIVRYYGAGANCDVR
jgi:hypothetical protein